MKTSPRANKSPLSGRHRIEITAPTSLLPMLEEELKALGISETETEGSAISIQGGLEDAMLLNLMLSTANSVLIELASFEASHAEELYTNIRAYPWEELIEPTEYLCVTSNVHNPTIRDTRMASLKAKDAIVDRIKAKRGRRPDSGPDRSGAVIHIHWRGNRCSCFLDTSGEPLSKRGYRQEGGLAPMKEGLAAGIVMASGWDGKGMFVNPMCGSGTIAIEAALIALGKPPGLIRDNFGFMHVKGFVPSRWRAIKEKAATNATMKPSCRIIATDSDRAAIKTALNNARLAGVEGTIEFSVADFAATEVPDGEGIVMLNPPYGERLGDIKDLEIMYAGIGDFLKQNCKGKTGYIFSGNPALSKKVGLRTNRRMKFYNGKIECRLLKYELYEGTRKIKKNGAEEDTGWLPVR